MKNIMRSLALFICVLLSGCVVKSYYPLYESEDDLIVNDDILGMWEGLYWEANDTIVCVIENAKDTLPNFTTNSCTYILKFYHKKHPSNEANFYLHLLKFDDEIFCDIYAKDLFERTLRNNLFVSMNVMPVHTFARVRVTSENLQFDWLNRKFVQETVSKLENGKNTLLLNHENNPFLIARSKELQRLLKEHLINSEEAFKDNAFVHLKRIY